MPSVRSFAVLGPLEVLVDGVPATLGGQRRRSLLTRLLLEPNRVVPADRLIEDLWGDRSTATTANTLQVGISALRTALEPDREHRAVEPVLAHMAGGYVLRVDDGQLDVQRFERLVAEGRRRLGIGQAEGAAATLGEAIAEFRGQPLPDLAGQPCAMPEIIRLEEELETALEDRVEAILAAGRHVEAVPELERLTRAAPLRERRWSQLMLALYRSGRQSDALRAFAAARDLLIEELGVEPSPLLRDLEQAMLQQRPELDVRLRAEIEPAHSTMTLVFTDIAGSTAMAGRLGDVEYDRIRTAHVGDVRRAAEACGGHVVDVLGDGVLLRFASASAALRAAIDIQRVTEDAPVAVKVGMDAGEPVETPDHDVIGTCVNRAARLADAAAGGEILASSTVRALVEARGDVRFGERRTLELKGFDTPQEAHAVPWADAPRPALRHPAPLVATDAYVGRSAELGELKTAWRQVVEGRPAVAVVRGEPGAGKTRLVAELSREVAAAGGVVLYGRCERDGSSYEPFREALGRYVAELRDDELAEVLGPYASDLAAVVPALADRVPQGPPTELDPAVRLLRLHEAIEHALGQIAGRGSVLLVLDDLHWADAATTALVARAAQVSAPMLLVLAYRNTDTDRTAPIVSTLADLGRSHGVEAITLHGLDEDEVSGCMEARAGRACARGVARLVHARTGGNPLLVEELTRALVREDALDDPDRATADETVPASVRSLVEARLAVVTPDEETVIDGAAVLGAEFDWEAVAPTTGLDEAVVATALDRLVAAGLLVEVRGTVGRYGFAHDLVRQAVHDRLGSARRLSLHRRAADAIASLDPSRLGDIANHLLAGASPANADRAIEAAVAAAEAASDRVAHGESARWYARALEVVGDDGPADHRARLHLARADALTLDGDFAAARATYRAAAADAETVGDGELLCRAALGFSGPTSSMWVEWGSHDVELESLLDRADLALGPVPTPLRARLLAARAAHLAVVDPREADRWSAAALAMAESLRDQAAERAALVGRRMAVWRPDALDERLRLDDRLVDLADGHPRAEFDGLGFLLMDLVEAGRMEEADDVADRIDRIGAELDWGFPRWNALRYRAMRLGMGGHLDEVLAVAGEALAAGQSANPENAAGSYGAVLLAVGFHRAEVTGLADSLQSLADAQPRMSPYSAAVPFYLAEEGRMDEAGEAVAALGARLDEVRLGPDWLSTMCLFAYAVHAAGDRAVAEDLLARLGPFGGLHATVGGIVFTLGPTDRYLGLLSETVGDVTAADVHFDAARARAGELGCPLYGALTLVEQGRCLRAAGLDPGRSDDLLSAAAELAADLDLPLVRRKLDQVEEAA